MALDKQLILNELGSVMNKLQSADCGCMGKLFSDQGQYNNQGGQGAATMGSPLPTCGGCRRGHCHGHGYGGYSNGYSAPSAGEPNSMHTPCMGMQCNPHKLYAETYNYLNGNLMQPVVNEVYQDLKSINPSNSIMNNPMASKLGLQQPSGGAGMPGNIGMTQNQMPGSDMGDGMQNPNMAMNQQMGGQLMNNQQMGSQQMSHFGGMGPNIVNMMNGDGKNSGKTSQITPMSASAPQGQVSGEMGQYNAQMSNNAAAYGGQQPQSQYMQQSNMSSPMNPNSQRNMQQNMGGNMQQNMGGNTQQNIGGNTQQNMGHPGAAYKVNYSNPAAQQMSANQNKPNYGQHTPGITKFNEMFPGVMGGDLGFDPMSIAIQMNPANQQQAAMGQMQKIMNGNPIEQVLDSRANAMQPAIAGSNAAAAALNPVSQQNIPPSSPQQNFQQGYTNSAANPPNQAQQQAYGQVPHQQVYTAVTGTPTMNQNQTPQYQQQQPQQYQQPQDMDSNSQKYQYQQQQHSDLTAQGMSPSNLPHMYNGQIGNMDPNADPNQQPPQSNSAPPTSTSNQMLKEPIFPVDTSRNMPPPHMKYQKPYEYNTLGQPVELLPAKMFHPAPDNNPQQTLSPQPITRMGNDQSRFVVKNTVSKTSLMGSRPVGRAPSRNQLQQIYNQYKGSQSYTQQNIRSPGQGATFSEGKINVTNTNQHRHVPVERLAGDTLANNQLMNNQVPVKGQPMGHVGDVPMSADNKPYGDIAPANAGAMKKTRNGLQDLVYTSYPTSAAWSFHGNRESQRSTHYPSTGYRRRA